ncbi:hypothetical protein [Cronobacter dublinensis]|uniref:hypothetical protein n=1 Tax=Cronobacter dublinensis TaxID=413497 RepID=UPI001395E7A9|nr:hypothetical protein [Cronobacter dublinensis]
MKQCIGAFPGALVHRRSAGVPARERAFWIKADSNNDTGQNMLVGIRATSVISKNSCHQLTNIVLYPEQAGQSYCLPEFPILKEQNFHGFYPNPYGERFFYQN